MEKCFKNIAEVLSYYKKGIRVGTAVTRGILDKLKSPDSGLKIIHIAGTNGKGSVAEYITQILIAAGKRVGTFQSPAVFSYEEQFRIDGKPIDLERLDKYFAKTLEAANCTDATGFELETAGAIYAFKQEGCEYAVIECGMGGRDDATNAVLKKELALITSISLEHTAYLGGTVEEICANKAGIIKNCPVFVSGYNSPQVLEFFKKLGASVAANYENPPLYGEAQKYNCGLAIEAAKFFEIDETSIYSGVNRVKLAGRVEFLSANGANYILDGAHNPAAFAPLIEFLEEHGGADVAVYGSLSDKDIDRNIIALKPYVGKIYAVAPDSPRAMDIGKVLATCVKYGVAAETFNSVSKALDKACGTVVVCGSFTILSEAKKWIEKK